VDFELTTEERATLMAEATLGIRPESSKLAPLTPAEREWRELIGREVTELTRAGFMIDIPI
jgi:hypothetical protein